jgi:hypothetical protein
LAPLAERSFFSSSAVLESSSAMTASSFLSTGLGFC